jgi:hypothetical protein
MAAATCRTSEIWAFGSRPPRNHDVLEEEETMKSKTLLRWIPLFALVAQPLPLAAKPRSGMQGIAAIEPGYCKTTGGNEGLIGMVLAAILPGLVKSGVKGIGDALTKAGQPDETTISGAASDHFYSLDQAKSANGLTTRCMAFQVVYDGPQADTQNFRSEARKFYDERGQQKAVAFLYTARVELAGDGSAWRLVPETIHVGPSLTASAKGNRGRDLVLTMTVQGAAAKDNENVLATRSVNIARVADRLDTNLIGAGETETASYGTGWMPLPAVQGDIAAGFIEARKRLIERQKLEQIEARKPAEQERLAELNRLSEHDAKAFAKVLPITVKFDLHETTDGNKFLMRVGEFISGQSDKIAAPIIEQLDPAKRREAEVKALTESTGLRVDAIAAIAAWNADKKEVNRLKAQLACDKLRVYQIEESACSALSPR